MYIYIYHTIKHISSYIYIHIYILKCIIITIMIYIYNYNIMITIIITITRITRIMMKYLYTNIHIIYYEILFLSHLAEAKAHNAMARKIYAAWKLGLSQAEPRGAVFLDAHALDGSCRCF